MYSGLGSLKIHGWRPIDILLCTARLVDLFFRNFMVLILLCCFIKEHISRRVSGLLMSPPVGAVLLSIASWSATSFPWIPTWLGIQIKLIFVPSELWLIVVSIISDYSGLESSFLFWIASSDALESVKIDASSHSEAVYRNLRASTMAVSSAENMLVCLDNIHDCFSSNLGM